MAPSGGTEFEEFERLLSEDVTPGNSHGWTIKKDWPARYSPQGFMMRVCLRPHGSGNPNNLLRGDGRYQGAKPAHFLEYLLNPESLPGLQELRDVETLPGGDVIKYLRVKAPLMAPRDHVWRYTVDRREDGSIFVCVRTTHHEKCPVKKGVIRAYYYNACIFAMSKEQEGVMEMTEFIFQDLKGGVPVCLMNAALPIGTVKTNEIEMKHFKSKGLLG